MRLHTLAGLPRSGSTLLANILSQHPDVYVSGTSALCQCTTAVVDTLSAAAEVQSDLANVPGAYEGYERALRGLAEGWYGGRDEPVIVDKGRGWITHQGLLGQLWPGSAMIVTVRDPRDVVASIECQNRRTPVFNSPVARTLYEAADLLMKQDGIVGGPMRFCEDLVRRNAKGVQFVRYESFVRDPGTVMAKLDEALGIESCGYDFDHIENVATDLDALYRGKYPHDGSGSIKVPESSWREVMDEGLGALIAGAFPLYVQTFGYD